MKKSWIIAGLIGALLALELVLRALDDAPETPEPQVPVIAEPAPQAEAPKPVEPSAPAAPKEADQPNSLISGEPGSLPPLNKEYLEPDACQGFVSAIEKKGGRDYSSADVAYLSTLQDVNNHNGLAKLVTEFVTCKAVERQDYNACTDIKKLVSPGNTIPCGQVFMLFIPLRAHFIMRMQPDAFEDLYEDLPKNVLDWMVAFMKTLAAGDAAGCERLSTDPLILFACQTATGGAAAPAAGSELTDAYYTVQTLRTSQLSFLSQVHPGLPVDLVNVLLGKTGVCERTFTSEALAFCESKRKRPPVNDPALETAPNPPVGTQTETAKPPAPAPLP